MNVLQVIPALVAGGAEQTVVDVSAALAQAGHGSFVASSGGARVREIEAAGGTHFTLPLASKNPLTIIANSRRLAALIRAQRIDIIHARSRAPAWSAWLAARATGCRYVTTFHAAYAFKSKAKQAYNRIMARGARIIAISAFIAEHIRTHYGLPPERIVTIPRSVDLARFAPERVTPERIAALRAAWRAAPDQPIILLPARLSRIKGQTVLIEAMRLLAEQNKLPGVIAVLIGAEQGRSAYTAALRAQISGARLEKRVVLADHCQDMPAAYAAAALVVAPSLVPEGFGRVPVEAQAMGAPVIAADYGAFRETVLPGVTGWLVPPNDAPALAEKIAEIMTMPAAERSALANRAMAHARAHYAVEKMTQATLAVYRGVLEAV